MHVKCILVLINNLLASGEIPDLFVDDEVENIGKKQALKKYDQFSLNNLCKNFVKQSIASRITPINYFFYLHSHYGQKWSQRCWFTRYKRKLLEIFHWPSSKTIESYFVLFSRWKNFESSRKKISGFNQLHMYWLVSWGKGIFLCFL